MATSPMEKVTNNSGSNYCKMPDGTLIQWRNSNIGDIAPMASTDFTINFTLPFISIPIVITQGAGGSYTPRVEMTGPNIWNVTTTSFKGRLRSDYSNTLDNVFVPWIAIGRWK